MADIFFDTATALAQLLGTTQAIAGYILGSVVVVAILIIVHWAIGGISQKETSNTTFMVSAGLGVVVATLVGWYPLWVIIFLTILLVFAIVRPFGQGAGGVG